jgi:hypothetical protein
VHTGQISVEHHHAVVVDGKPHQRFPAVTCDVHGHGHLAQSRGDGLGQQRLVLDDEYPHPRGWPPCESTRLAIIWRVRALVMPSRISSRMS